MSIQSLGWEDPLEEGLATHSNIFAWRIPWTELQSVGSQRVRHNWSDFAHMHKRGSSVTFLAGHHYCLLANSISAVSAPATSWKPWKEIKMIFFLHLNLALMCCYLAICNILRIHGLEDWLVQALSVLLNHLNSLSVSFLLPSSYPLFPPHDILNYC